MFFLTDYNKQIVELIDDFSFFENWEDKYQYLIDLGRNIPKMDEKLKVDENKLKGSLDAVVNIEADNNDLPILEKLPEFWEKITKLTKISRCPDGIE